MVFIIWNIHFVIGFTQFLARDVQDTFPQLIDNGLRMLLQLLTSWKNALGSSRDRLTKDVSTNEASRTSFIPRRTEHLTVWYTFRIKFETSFYSQ